MESEFSKGLKEQLSEDLKTRVIHHRNRFVKIFTSRFLEMLASLIVYQNDVETNRLAIDFLRVEVALRAGYHLAVGENKLGNLQVLGYVRTPKSSENPIDLFTSCHLTEKDIEFIIPEKLRHEEYKEIQFADNCQTGNFVVLKNKTLRYVDDMEILQHYATELAEIVLSRYSVTMQAKIITFFISEVGDETINEVVTDLYNGAPYSKVSKLFDPETQIVHLQAGGIASLLTELKREYQNKISELNNMLGINSLAIEKTSGVSDTEAKSNRAFTSSNANIYLKARQHGLDKLNKRYNLNIQAIYNDEVASEFSAIAYSASENEEVEKNENYDDTL